MKEAEIRPQEIFEEYLKLSTLDGQRLERSKFIEIDCPGCGRKSNPIQFIKHDFSYKKCDDCQSLYCSPRPSNEQLSEFYTRAESSHFWSKVFFPKVVNMRREKLFKPKAKRIYDLIKSRDLSIETLCDVGAGHGLFLEELREHLPSTQFFAVEPDANSAEVCRAKGFGVLQKNVEAASEWKHRFDFVICSEVIEHVFDVKPFLKSLSELAKPGGYCLITGLGYDGFDILTLQENSKSVFPPHHLNFLSVDGFEKALGASGFTEVDIWTPGVLDVDIVANSGIQNEFVATMVRRGPKIVEAFQKFLSEHKLSSHTWILAKT